MSKRPAKKINKAEPPLTPAQKAAATRARKKREADALVKADAERLAQVVNLHISGMSYAQIGAAIGATADDVEDMLVRDTQRYIKTQPALRVYVRNWVSERYTSLLDTVWDGATDATDPKMLEHQDRAVKILDRMAKLHGAEAPTQTEVTVDAAPEAVEKMVNALAAQQGLGYDVDIFAGVSDVVDAEVVHDAVEQSGQALVDSGEMVGETQDGDNGEGF